MRTRSVDRATPTTTPLGRETISALVAMGLAVVGIADDLTASTRDAGVPTKASSGAT
jgi:hypothetical protein